VDREDLLRMKPREIKRLHLIHQALDRKISQKQAAQVAGLSPRQMRRLMKRVEAEGDRGIVHRRRGKPSNRRIAAKTKQKVLALFEKHYADYGPTLASEKLQERHRIQIHPETLRLWLGQARLPYKQRKARPHRQWRPRRSCFGEMVQLDGSHHDWLEGRGPKLVLMGYIDDATSTVEGRFYDHEGTVPALDSFRRWVQRFGIPCSVYLDKHTTYRSSKTLTVEEQLEGREQSQSQFQRAMSELGVEVIHAHSPAAKGRVERLFQTLQDRLVKELRLAKASTLAEANQVLHRYLPLYNQRFGVQAAQPTDLHRRVPTGLDLDTVLCLKTRRRLNADSTVQHEGQAYLVEDRIRGQAVMVHQHLDGSVHLRCCNRSLNYRPVPYRPRKMKPTVKPAIGEITRHRPAAEHPWRGSYKRPRPEIHPRPPIPTLARGVLPPAPKLS
jgi:molybdenum-dependent DNA-binding transcriptional regulator ModE